MSKTLTVSSSQGRPAEWHDTICEDGKRLTGVPKNADEALAFQNEHWIGERHTSDADKFNAIFKKDVDEYNARQTRSDRKMGAESTKKERQKSYYDGVMDGTFCYGSGKMKENPIEEIVIQVGNKDDCGVTDRDFDMNKWKRMKESGDIKDASEYALKHLNKSEDVVRTKRILYRTMQRIASIDPEHIVVIRADYHADEPCGTGHGHLGFIPRATGYDKGMSSRVAMVRALEQAGFKHEKGKEFGIVQLHEHIRDIIEEEMIADAKEYGYEPYLRAEISDEKRPRSEADVFREMAEERDELKKTREDVQAKVKSAEANLEMVRLDTEALERKNSDMENIIQHVEYLEQQTLQEMSDLKKEQEEHDRKKKQLDAKTKKQTAKEKELDRRDEEVTEKEAAAESQRQEYVRMLMTNRDLIHDMSGSRDDLPEEYGSVEELHDAVAQEYESWTKALLTEKETLVAEKEALIAEKKAYADAKTKAEGLIAESINKDGQEDSAAITNTLDLLSMLQLYKNEKLSAAAKTVQDIVKSNRSLFIEQYRKWKTKQMEVRHNKLEEIDDNLNAVLSKNGDKEYE